MWGGIVARKKEAWPKRVTAAALPQGPITKKNDERCHYFMGRFPAPLGLEMTIAPVETVQ